MPLVRNLITLLACLVGFTAYAQVTTPDSRPPAAPVEMMVMDPAGRTLVGHGVADGSELHLRLKHGLGSFVVLLVDTTGSIATLEGREGRGGQLWLRQSEGGEILLVELLRSLGIRLTVERVGEEPVAMLDDEPGPTPTRPPPSDDEPTDDGSGDGGDDDDGPGDDDGGPDDDDDDRDDDDDDDLDDD